jgi:hypothetical protein
MDIADLSGRASRRRASREAGRPHHASAMVRPRGAKGNSHFTLTAFACAARAALRQRAGPHRTGIGPAPRVPGTRVTA